MLHLTISTSGWSGVGGEPKSVVPCCFAPHSLFPSMFASSFFLRSHLLNLIWGNPGRLNWGYFASERICIFKGLWINAGGLK